MADWVEIYLLCRGRSLNCFDCHREIPAEVIVSWYHEVVSLFAF